MKSYSVFAKKVILRVTPVIATWMLSSAPVLAATLAGSFGELTFTNFNQESTEVGAINEAEGSAKSNSDDSVADFQNFSITNSDLEGSKEISNVADSLVFGEGSNYTASAKTAPRFFANFDVDSNETLSFNFTAYLDVEASVDKPGVETANAAGNISFYLVDTTGTSADNRLDFLNSTQLDPNQIPQNNILESFTVAASTDALGNSSTSNTSSQNVNFSSNSSNNVSGSQAINSSFFEGSVERSFKEDKNVTLVAFKNTKVKVKVPEPQTALGSILFAALIVIAMRARKKAQDKSS